MISLHRPFLIGPNTSVCDPAKTGCPETEKENSCHLPSICFREIRAFYVLADVIENAWTGKYSAIPTFERAILNTF
jgi:hypothetical protein